MVSIQLDSILAITIGKQGSIFYAKVSFDVRAKQITFYSCPQVKLRPL